MYKFLSVLGFVVLFSLNVKAATFSAPDTLWTRTYGEANIDIGNSVQQTQDNGFIVAGYTAPTTSEDTGDVYLLKVNSTGDTVWTKTYGDSADDRAYSVKQSFDNGFIIAGYTASFGHGKEDVYLIKTDSAGDTLWTKTYGGTEDEEGTLVQQTFDNGTIIVGYTTSFGAGLADVYLIKTDSIGDTLWTRTYGGSENDVGISVQQTQDSGFIVAGWTASFDTNYADFYLIKTDVNGDTLWTRTFAKYDYTIAYSVRQTKDNGFIVAGIMESDMWDIDVYLVKTDANGDTMWTRTYGGYDDEEVYCVEETQDSGFIIAGYVGAMSVGSSYLIRTNANGDTMWTRSYGGTNDNKFSFVQQTQDEGFVAVGYLYSSGADVYLVKLGKEPGIEENNKSVSDITLQIQPNPFTNISTIAYQLPKESFVSLKLYDMSGRCVKTLTEGIKKSGYHNENLEAKRYPNGVYFIKFATENHRETKKLVLMR
ncbi:MAG: T9SS type A sorting domain-containing protein [bacterium]|nr:T9SS type A sorting domain-containing protein [bacterium]